MTSVDQAQVYTAVRVPCEQLQLHGWTRKPCKPHAEQNTRRSSPKAGVLCAYLSPGLRYQHGLVESAARRRRAFGVRVAARTEGNAIMGAVKREKLPNHCTDRSRAIPTHKHQQNKSVQAPSTAPTTIQSATLEQRLCVLTSRSEHQRTGRCRQESARVKAAGTSSESTGIRARTETGHIPNPPVHRASPSWLRVTEKIAVRVNQMLRIQCFTDRRATQRSGHHEHRAT